LQEHADHPDVGTDLIIELARDPKYREDPEQLGLKLRPELLEAFPVALLGRIVTKSYFPLSNSMLDGIVQMQLGRIASTHSRQPQRRIRPHRRRSSIILFESATIRILAAA
jgi:ATP-dependent Clp protease ATP-binding subunit ClpA